MERLIADITPELKSILRQISESEPTLRGSNPPDFCKILKKVYTDFLTTVETLYRLSFVGPIAVTSQPNTRVIPQGEMK